MIQPISITINPKSAYVTYNGSKIGEKIKIYDDGTKFEIKNSKRIGITKHADWEQRYIIAENSYVSGNKRTNVGQILKRS